MNKYFFLPLLIFFLILPIQANAENRGNLLIIGGGSRPDYLIKKFVELAGGSKANLIIIPNASNTPLEVGVSQKKEFEKYKPQSVEYLIFSRKEADMQINLNKMSKASGVFFSGGDQTKLFSSLNGSRLLDKIQELYYENGGVIGGTSAGAAVMSKIMLTGTELLHKNVDFISIQQKNVQTTTGFGFVSKAIIDQHFIKRKRQNRLISLVLENPALPCIGIDESTAIIVKANDILEVLGENTVMIFDASRAKNIHPDKNKNLAAENIIMHILSSGQKYSLRTKSIVE
jgi:cyanophycinase